jgi:glycosyltransferase involved in cell wall biosynthesis
LVVDGPRNARIICFATHGADHLDARRLDYLLEPLQPQAYAFDYARKRSSALGLLRTVFRQRPELIVMEGTGIAGGLTLLAIDALLRIPFVISSGDAVGPYLSLRSPLAGLLGGVYERLLCRRSAGFVGWTPYLAGRAMTFGAPRAMTAPGWSTEPPAGETREQLRRRLGIPPDALVVGLVGSLDWTDSVQYVYGLELVRAVRRISRPDVVVCIVGDGSGRQRLAELAGEDLGGRVLLPGRVAHAEVADYLAAFDLASLSQSVDAVGSFRYSTKLSEYLAAGLPILSAQIPAAYDLDDGCFWRLPGPAPWSEVYIGALAELLEGLTETDLAERRAAARDVGVGPFDAAAQQQRMVAFVRDILAARHVSG